jgi:hypothetical protein
MYLFAHGGSGIMRRRCRVEIFGRAEFGQPAAGKRLNRPTAAALLFALFNSPPLRPAL